MAEGPTAVGGEESQPAEDTSPKRLLREALSLAVILGATLTLATLERRGMVPGQGYPSSLLLLVLGLWHRRRFRVAVRLFRPRRGSRVFPVVFAVTLVLVLLISAYSRRSPQFGLGPSAFQLLHLVIIVPLSEELYFRGLLLEHLRRGFGSVQAVLLCSLLFGLLHLPTGAALLAGGLSLLACLLVVKSGALAYAFQIHVAWNGLSEIHRYGNPSSRWIWAVAASAVVAALALGSLRRPSPRDPAR